MDLSVIIVNFNVKYFLEQCLHAVVHSSKNINAEIIVIDNNSVDGSIQMVQEKFPEVRLMINSSNEGFAKASNQGIKQASGEYLLLLNPDTVVQEDTFKKCIDFMNIHPDAGSLGVKMIDGKGKFLPESKRALPTPKVAFYKIFGLSSMFPRSVTFGKYHLGYLDRDSVHQVDVISGAFMFIRRKAIEKTGLLDERFFMYGEDIDFSYRLLKNGFINYYFPETAIIHYKGESTKKGSINYVVMFYNAMIIFARKHFSTTKARYFTTLIQFAIYIRAGMSILQRFMVNIVNPLASAVIIYAGYYLFIPVWAAYIFGAEGNYPAKYLLFIVPAYIIVWLLSIYFSGGFEKHVRLKDLIKGTLFGTVMILIVYALLPEQLRYSRAMIIMGTFWVLISTVAVRIFLGWFDKKNFRLELSGQKKRIAIAGGEKECKRILNMLDHAGTPFELAGFVHVGDSEEKSKGYIGHMNQIDDIVMVNRIEEIIFCAGDLKAERIIRTMLMFSDTEVEFKIAPPESLSIIGSNSIRTAGDLYDIHFNTLSRKLNRRKKRLLDMLMSLFFLLVSPVMVFFVENPSGFLRNIWRTFFGLATWVSVYKSPENIPDLPGLKPGILNPADQTKSADQQSHEVIEKMNLLYAKNYSIFNDLSIILQSCRKLGRRQNV